MRPFMHSVKKLLFTLILVFATGFFLSACEEKEMDDLAKAQDCLDKVEDSNLAQANVCISYVAKYDSQQANIIKCSGKFLAGGLTTSKIIDAFTEYEEEGNGENKDSLFIGYLALNPSSLATEAVNFCRRTGVDGFMYLADLAVVGSVLGEVGTGFSNPPTQTEIDNALDTCKTNPATCQPEVIAPAVTSLASSYCSKPSAADDEVCKDVNAAIAQAGGDNDEITKALTCFLGGGTYASGVCTP